MRMTASWSGRYGPTEYKVVARYFAPDGKLPSDRFVVPLKKNNRSTIEISVDRKCPIQGLLRLHSRYGPLDRWTARSGLCHEASARAVARPSRSSATRSIDNSLGGTLLRW